MFFKRKIKNKRREREFLLDVKLRSAQIRANRMRFAGIVFGSLFGILLTGIVIWRGGEWLLNRFLYENEAFAIRQIRVQTDGVIATNHIVRWTLLKPNQNLLALDLAKVKRDLELVPLVQSASVERVLPNGLMIRVSERKPVAQIPMVQAKAGGGYEQINYHIDDSGFVFHPLDPRLRAKTLENPVEQLPIISGVDARELRAGKQAQSDAMRAVLELIREFEHSPMVGYVDLLRIDLATPDILHIYTGQGSEIFLSFDNFPQQLNRWRMVHDQSLMWGKAIASLDLSVANNAPLRLAEVAPSTTTPRSKNVKPPTRTSRRRNV